MDYNVKEIKELLKGFNPEHFTAMDEDSLFSLVESHTENNEKEWTWDEGATKAVIIPKNENYVIKIPFDGSYDVDEKNICGELVFYPFYNGGGCDGWDYCELENEYYDELVKGSGFEEFFLRPIHINEYGWPIYVQEKVKIYGEISNPAFLPKLESLETTTEQIKNKTTRIPAPWLAIALENLNDDIERFNEFLDFLEAYFSDLHRNNLGILNGHAVIIDFAGYGE